MEQQLGTRFAGNRLKFHRAVHVHELQKQNLPRWKAVGWAGSLLVDLEVMFHVFWHKLLGVK